MALRKLIVAVTRPVVAESLLLQRNINRPSVLKMVRGIHSVPIINPVDVDFRQKPMFQRNPYGVNERVNDANNSAVSARVRNIVNHVANPAFQLENGNASLFHLFDEHANHDAIIQSFELDKLTPVEHESVAGYLEQIFTATDNECKQVSTLVDNHESLMQAANRNIKKYEIKTIVTAAIMSYIDYQVIKHFGCSPCDSNLLVDIANASYVYTWGWMFTMSSCSAGKKADKAKAHHVDLYSHYVTENFISKYQFKLDMLRKLRERFDMLRKLQARFDMLRK